MQKEKMVVRGGLANSYEKKSDRQKKQRKMYSNAGFQRIVRRDRKAFLGDQSKEMEGNNRL